MGGGTTVEWEPHSLPEGDEAGEGGGRVVPIRTSGRITIDPGEVRIDMEVEVRRVKGVGRVGEWVLRRQLRRLVQFAESRQTAESEAETPHNSLV